MREALKFVRGKSWTGSADEFDRFIVKTITDNRRLIQQADIRVN
jgi:hypothetical protein